MAKSVRETMTGRPRCITGGTTAAEAARVMRQEDVGALPIVDEEARLLGIVTDRDLAVRVLAEDLEGTTPVRAVASEELVAVDAEQDLDDAVVLMAQHQLRRLPVVDEERRLVGMLSQADVALVASEKDAGRVVSEISKPLDGPRL
jgi:CBS domain-containing protein